MRSIPYYVVLVALISVIGACTGPRIGQGGIIRDQRMLVEFDAIEVGNAFQVELRPGPLQVVVESDKNLLPYIETEVKGGVLTIYTEEDIDRASSLRVYISMPELKELKVSDAAEVFGRGVFTQKKIKLDLEGSSDLHLDVNVDKLDLSAKNSPDITLSGQAEKADIDLADATDLYARSLIVQKLDINLSDASDARITCIDKLDANAKDRSTLDCYGQPTQDDVKTDDAAKVSLMR